MHHKKTILSKPLGTRRFCENLLAYATPCQTRTPEFVRAWVKVLVDPEFNQTLPHHNRGHDLTTPHLYPNLIARAACLQGNTLARNHKIGTAHLHSHPLSIPNNGCLADQI